MNWSEKDLAAHLERTGTPGAPNTADVSRPPFHLPAEQRNASNARFALGRLKPGAMNRLEAEYSKQLELERAAGEILWWRFEAVKLRLADNTFLTVDFAVMTAPDGVLEMRETKGFMMDDANVKLKVAAANFPFRFVLIRKKLKRDGGGWLRTEY